MKKTWIFLSLVATVLTTAAIQTWDIKSALAEEDSCECVDENGQCVPCDS